MTPAKSPIPIQLCLQGGAAKIALLAAFVDAIEELHNNGTVRITRISGTSAGAIIGTLFAAAVPMSTVRNRLGTAPLDKIVPFKNNVSAGFSLARGVPLWNEDELRALLKKLLAESSLANENPPKEINTFTDIRRHRFIDTSVMATNLVDTRSVVRKGDDPIVTSLLESAAIPFFFRAQKSANSTIVDGGLCENLPSDLLTDDPEDGPIVAISFRRGAGATPRNVREYCMAVVSAGIDHSVDRAKRVLEERAKRSSLPHQVFLIDSEIESFDFEKAVHDGLGKTFETVRKQAMDWLTKFVDRRRKQILSEREMEESKLGQQIAIASEAEYYRREMPRNIARMYKAQHEPVTLRWTYARLAVTVAASHEHPDRLNHIAKFHTRDQRVWCHRLPVLVTQPNPATLRSNIHVYGPDDKEISYYDMFMDEDGTLEWLVCFDQGLPPQSGPYTLILVDSVLDFMKPLRNAERDDIWVSFHRKEGVVDQVEVIAYVPDSLPRLQVEPMAGAREWTHIQPFELNPHLPSPSHIPYGLRGSNITENRWGMYLTRKK
jgi:predicted acylesterase/phospholipase RssA